MAPDAQYMAAYLGGQAMRLLLTLVAARVLAQRDVAAWNLILTLPWYFQLVQLGAANALNRELPIGVGSGDQQRIHRIVRTALWWTVVPTAAAALALASMLFAMDVVPRPAVLIGTAAYIVAQHVFTFSQIYHLATGGVRVATAQQLATVITVAMTMVGVAIVPDLGLFVGLNAAGLAVAAAIGTRSPRRWLPLPDRSETRRLAVIGIPIMLIGVVQTLILSLDRWVIAGTLGAAALASYTPAVLASASIQMLPSGYAQLFYARMGREFGRAGTASGLRHLLVRQGTVAYAVTLSAAIILSVGIVVLIPVVLPAYREGIPSAVVLAIGLASLSFAAAGANVLNVLGRARLYLGIQLVTIVAMMIATTTAGRVDGRLVVVALTVAVFVTLYSIAVFAAGLYVTRRGIRDTGHSRTERVAPLAATVVD